MPVKIGFNIKVFDNKFQFFYRNFGLAMNFIEIIFSFNTGYFEKGLIIIDRFQLFKWSLILYTPRCVLTILSIILSEYFIWFDLVQLWRIP